MRDIQATLMGNATADPTERKHPDGSTSAILRLAVTGRYYDQEKESFVDRKTEFVSVYARRALGRNIIDSVRKGQPVIVTGRMGSSEWTTQNGEVRHSLTMQAEAVGHDLTFGTSRFVKPLRAEDNPDIDYRTGEISGDPTVTDSEVDELLTRSSEEVDDSLTAS